jgi:uncharacterized protein with FMN-binding domain
MKRSPIVAAGTVVGLASVLGFHTSPVKISLNPSPGTTGPSPTTTTTRPVKNPPTTTVANHPTTTTHQSSSTTTTTTTTVAPSGPQTVTGPTVNYYYGILSVKVTTSGHAITGVTIGTINDGGNPRSQQIDQYAIPILEQEAMSAQNSQIQSVSGASYTSAGFQMSLQDALKNLGLK